MLRPVLAFLTLCVAAFLLAPTVASVHDLVEDLKIDRDLPYHLWKWDDRPAPPDFPDCGGGHKHLYSEITQWPTKIRKDEPFALSGIVASEEDGRLGVPSMDVDIFLNKTKSEPGIFLGSLETSSGGTFLLSTSIPFDLQAAHYHIVAHAKTKRVGCTLYLEHWSDPEVDIVSKSRIAWDNPAHPVAGRAMNVTGRLLDSVGGPIQNATLNVTVGDETLKLVTDDEGKFSLEHTPARAGNLTLSASYKGSPYYEASKDALVVDVEEEAFEFVGEPYLVVRSQSVVIGGIVYVADDARQPTITIDLDGIQATACDGCAPNDTFEAPVDGSGAFQLTLTVPSTEAPGVYTLDAFGGGLSKAYVTNVTLDMLPQIAVEAEGTSLFTRGYEGHANLTDEAGRPLEGASVALLTPEGWVTATTDANGTVSFAGKGECGVRPVHALHNGTGRVRSVRAQDDAYVCGFLAFIPPWLLAIPWWAWILGALAALAAWQSVRAWRQRYAPVIAGGPALTLSFTEPSDHALGYAGIGETVVATAFLEAPLPDGHRLRMGARRATNEVPLDAELRAHLRVVPDKLGEVPIRAEIVDAKGRVVSRRTLALRVVAYAQEIERRYLALRRESGASEAVTPREFERWIQERAPALDADVARRLVGVFEEADYSPRVAGRREFAAYMSAEAGLAEVSPDATMA